MKITKKKRHHKQFNNAVCANGTPITIITKHIITKNFMPFYPLKHMYFPSSYIKKDALPNNSIC